jgi:hypothetical protein
MPASLYAGRHSQLQEEARVISTRGIDLRCNIYSHLQASLKGTPFGDAFLFYGK